jgi:serine/threonine protein kinase
MSEFNVLFGSETATFQQFSLLHAPCELLLFWSVPRSYMHARSLAHLDVKPGNATWISDLGMLKIIDLGMAMQFPVPSNQQLPYVQYVTSLYRPPELWIKGAMAHLLNPQVDFWSWGCSVYEMATGCHMMSPMNPTSPLDDLNGVFPMIREWKSSYWIRQHMRVRGTPGANFSQSEGANRLTVRLARLSKEAREAVVLACHPEPCSRTLSGSAMLWKAALIESK